jgi:hypothetical protein
MRYRYARPPDFRRCLELAQTDPVPYGDLLTKLPDIWRELLNDHRMIASVVETDSGELISFGASVFVNPKWAADLLLQPRPYPAIEAYKSILDRSPVVLNLDEISHGNSVDGLVLLCLHGVTDPALQNEMLLEGRRELSQAYLHFHTGYRIREAMMECYSPDYLSLCLANGLQLRSRRDSPPYLVGHTKAEVIDSGVMFAAATFAYRKPQFGFSVSQQDVLVLALTRLSDHEIASALFISEHALKKRWEQIFERVDRTDAAFFPETRAQGGGRGPEKRTRLLNHLSDHREELRPHDPILVHAQSR